MDTKKGAAICIFEVKVFFFFLFLFHESEGSNQEMCTGFC